MNRDSTPNVLHKFTGEPLETGYEYVDFCWDLIFVFSAQQRIGRARNRIGRH